MTTKDVAPRWFYAESIAMWKEQADFWLGLRDYDRQAHALAMLRRQTRLHEIAK